MLLTPAQFSNFIHKAGFKIVVPKDLARFYTHFDVLLLYTFTLKKFTIKWLINKKSITTGLFRQSPDKPKIYISLFSGQKVIYEHTTEKRANLLINYTNRVTLTDKQTYKLTLRYSEKYSYFYLRTKMKIDEIFVFKWSWHLSKYLSEKIADKV